jgi:hypothetical protein
MDGALRAGRGGGSNGNTSILPAVCVCDGISCVEVLFEEGLFGAEDEDVLTLEACVVDGGGVSRRCSAGAAETYVLMHVRGCALKDCFTAIRRH